MYSVSVSVQYASSHTYPSDVHGCFTPGIHSRSLHQRCLVGRHFTWKCLRDNPLQYRWSTVKIFLQSPWRFKYKKDSKSVLFKRRSCLCCFRKVPICGCRVRISPKSVFFFQSQAVQLTVWWQTNKQNLMTSLKLNFATNSSDQRTRSSVGTGCETAPSSSRSTCDALFYHIDILYVSINVFLRCECFFLLFLH